MLGLATLLLASGDVARGEDALRQSLQSRSAATRYLARKRLAALYKKDGDFERAVPLWLEMVEENRLREVHPFIELAKYREHRLRDFAGALELVEMAIHLTGGRPIREMVDLQHRHRRLSRRAAV